MRWERRESVHVKESGGGSMRRVRRERVCVCERERKCVMIGVCVCERLCILESIGGKCECVESN